MKFNDLNIKTRIISGYSVALVMMAIIALIVTNGIGTLTQTAGWVEHTQDVISKSNQIMALAIDMETGERGFLITGDDGSLEPYRAAENSIFGVIDEVQELVSDNPQQVARFEDAKSMIASWMEQVAAVEIDERIKVREGEAVYLKFKEIQAETIGKEIFDNIRGALGTANSKYVSIRNRTGQILITEITLDLVNMETGQRGFLLSGEEPSLQPFNDGQKSLESNLANLGNISKADARNIGMLISEWVEKAATPKIVARRAMNHVEKVMDDVVVTQKMGNGKQYMDGLRHKINEIVGIETSLMESRQEDAHSAASSVNWLTIIGTLIAIALGIVISIFLANGISNPIGKLVNALEKLGDNDLRVRVDVESRDEVGKMSDSFNEAATNLAAAFNQIKNSSSQLGNASSEISAASEQMAAGAEEQQAQLSEVATSIEEMSAMILETSNNAEQTQGNAGEANLAAEKGRGTVDQTITGIEGIATIVASASDQISTLKVRSQEIADVIQVIDDISDQTNLLALNANIEAARAGEAGRGFAVVADEVRKLAERTVGATADIEDKIKQIQSDVNSSVEAMYQITEQSVKGQEMAGEAGQALGEISGSIDQVNGAITQIASAAIEQSAGVEQISKNVESVSTVSKQSASGAQELAASSEQLNREVQALDKLMDQFQV